MGLRLVSQAAFLGQTTFFLIWTVCEGFCLGRVGFFVSKSNALYQWRLVRSFHWIVFSKSMFKMFFFVIAYAAARRLRFWLQASSVFSRGLKILLLKKKNEKQKNYLVLYPKKQKKRSIGYLHLKKHNRCFTLELS